MGKRGPPKQPTKLRVLKGNPAKRPLPEAEPKPKEGEPACPADIRSDPLAWDKWCEVVVLLDDMQMLTVTDASVIAQLCRAHSTMTRTKQAIDREGMTVVNETKFGVTVKRHPLWTEYWSAENLLNKLLGQVGLTPSGRASLKVVKQKEPENPLIELMKVV